MSDEFYLPEDTVEWIAQKKSELLAWVIQHRDDGDIPFEEFTEYTERVPEALQSADETWEQKWDGHTIQVQLKMFEEESIVWLFVVSLKAPVMNEDQEGEVLVPVLILPTKHTSWLKRWLSGDMVQRKNMH
ncbi:MAG: hypothetical protein K2P81_01175 [Bacteriovoracaceae bacterium]|nr:hypothetical protein [Bacteriovoracaceae bacterium]